MANIYRNIILLISNGVYILIILILLGQAGSLFAVPACPDLFTGKQPDGKEFKMLLKGDEWTNWTETEDGYPIIINKNTGFWEYGKLESSKELSNPAGPSRVGYNGIPIPKIPSVRDGTDFVGTGQADAKQDGLLHPVRDIQNKRYGQSDTENIPMVLSLTGQVVGKDMPVGINKISAKDLKALMPARLDLSDPQAGTRPGGPEKSFRAPRPNAGGGQADASESPQSALLNITGTRKVLVILVNFADKSLTTTETNWYDRAFGTTNSAKKYYDEVSYNQLSITPAEETYGTTNNGVVIVTLTSNHPDTGNSRGTPNQQLTKDAIIAADPYVNFASFDSNSDGKITTDELHIMIVAAGYETSYTPNSSPKLWSHRWSINDIPAPVADGKTVGASPGGYIQFGELHGTSLTNHQATIGVIIHEFAHDCGTATTYQGLPDLYDTDSTSYGVGYWDSMSGGVWGTTTLSGDTPVHFGAWCKWYFGWITPTLITVSTNGVSFPQVETATGTDRGIKQVLNNPNGPEVGGTGEYFLIENRQKTGYDAALPGAGILIWHIDETQSDNTNEARKLVDLEEADGLNQIDNKTNEGNAGDPYPGTSANRTFSYASNPNSRLYSGADSTVSVINISNSAATMTADIIFADHPPVLTSPGDKNINENQLLTFTLSASDPDGDSITYSITPTPTGAVLNSTTGAFNWTPASGYAGTYSITFTATANGLSDYKTITITVSASPTSPAKPLALTATALSYYEIRLQWTDDSVNETGFKIERSPDNITFTQIAMVGYNITFTLDTNLSAETDYYYRIRAFNSAGNSDYSNIVSARTLGVVSAGSSGKGSHKAFSKCGCLGIEPLLILLLIRWRRKRKILNTNRTNRANDTNNTKR